MKILSLKERPEPSVLCQSGVKLSISSKCGQRHVFGWQRPSTATALRILMISQNRQAEIDRRKAEIDYRINIKAELEIEPLHQKVDLLREQEVMQLLQAVELLLQRPNSTERREASS
jgi:hypothetical protein